MDIQQIKVNELPLAATLTGLEVLGFNASTNEAVRAAISLLEGLDGKPIELQKTTTHIQWRIQGGAWSNLIALSDIKGEKGDTGDVGTPNSLSIGTVTSGSTPSATITGLSPSQTLNLTLPKGDIGPKGDKGDTGAKGDKGDTGAKGDKGDTGAKGEKGDTGPSNTLSIGTVTGGVDASASITGISPNQTLNLVLPKGEKGDTGLKGDTGAKGDTGEKGDKGDVGKSAYQVWLDAGNSGSISVYLNSLKGEKGDKGEQGLKGDTGEKGEQGLKGDTGDKGDKGDKGEKGDTGDTGDKGDKGWTPLYAEEADNNRIVRKLIDYIGGEGSKPTANLNQYLKSDGTFTSTKSEAMDVRVTGGTLPAGGTTGQALIKKSSTDFDTEWGSGGFGNVVADFTLSGAKEVYPQSVDQNGVFYAPNHGLLSNQYVTLFPNLTTVETFPHKFLWDNLILDNMMQKLVTVIDSDNFTVAGISALTFPSTHDITKWHFEVSSLHFDITGLNGKLFELLINGKIGNIGYLFIYTDPTSGDSNYNMNGVASAQWSLFKAGLIYGYSRRFIDARVGLTVIGEDYSIQPLPNVYDRVDVVSTPPRLIYKSIPNMYADSTISRIKSDTGHGFANGTKIKLIQYK
jgi:hypothetical protein